MRAIRYFIPLFLLFSACTIENLDPEVNIPKTDFSSYNYVLATEDASNVDITTFFTFNFEDVNPDKKYDLLGADDTFINSNPSTSSGDSQLNQYIFSMAKDKKGFSSTPGLYRLELNTDNRIFISSELNQNRNNLFPARQITIVNSRLGYFYDEGKEPQKIQMFDPTDMRLTGSIDLKPAIEAFRSDIEWVEDNGSNLVRTGSLVLDHNQGKLYVSIVFLETANFNLIPDTEDSFHLAVIDIESSKVEKIIRYKGAKTVGFFVSENKATTQDESGNMYFISWGWNQFNLHTGSRIFRIKNGETDFDPDWLVDIEKHFGPQRIVQSAISYNNKLYLHVSRVPYTFDVSDDPGDISMEYYEVDPNHPDEIKKLDLPISDTSSRMNVFSKIDDKLYISVPNIGKDKFNGIYSLDKAGNLKVEMQIENKYRPTRLYKLHK